MMVPAELIETGWMLLISKNKNKFKSIIFQMEIDLSLMPFPKMQEAKKFL